MLPNAKSSSLSFPCAGVRRVPQCLVSSRVSYCLSHMARMTLCSVKLNPSPQHPEAPLSRKHSLTLLQPHRPYCSSGPLAWCISSRADGAESHAPFCACSDPSVISEFFLSHHNVGALVPAAHTHHPCLLFHSSTSVQHTMCSVFNPSLLSFSSLDRKAAGVFTVVSVNRCLPVNNQQPHHLCCCCSASLVL